MAKKPINPKNLTLGLNVPADVTIHVFDRAISHNGGDRRLISPESLLPQSANKSPYEGYYLDPETRARRPVAIEFSNDLQTWKVYRNLIPREWRTDFRLREGRVYSIADGKAIASELWEQYVVAERNPYEKHDFSQDAICLKCGDEKPANASKHDWCLPALVKKARLASAEQPVKQKKSRFFNR